MRTEVWTFYFSKIFLIQDLERRSSPSTFHRILSFHEGSNKYLRTLKKGSKVYVETAFEIREAEPEADPSTPQGQRQIFLKHGELQFNAFFPDPLSFRDFRINQGPELSKGRYPRRSFWALKFLLKDILAFHPTLLYFVHRYWRNTLALARIHLALVGAATIPGTKCQP